jgi:GNAT superfamily N-acetyltransferase
MKTLGYDEVDPVGVLHLTMMALEFPLTPEYSAVLRRKDPRPFPELGVYAVEDNLVLAQVGVFRLPMVSSEGREDVGGVWAVSTHPEYSGRGIASRLLDEAHARMRDAGLRFSTLGTDRFRVAYKLYQKHGYVDVGVWATALAPWQDANRPTRLRAATPGDEGFDFVETVFQDIAKDHLGFAWRHSPFERLRRLSLNQVWILWDNGRPVGYSLTNADKTMLNISDLLLKDGIEASEAVAAVAAKAKADYVHVRISSPKAIASLQAAGYRVAYPDWRAFMIKPLVPEVTVEDARQFFGIGTDQFLISWLDVT